MNNIKIFGKFLDQPILVNKFKKSVPYVLTGAGTLYTLNTVHKSDEKKNTAVKSGLTMGGTIASALLAPKVCAKIFKNATDAAEGLMPAKSFNIGLIKDFINKNELPKDIRGLLEKNKGKVFKFKDLKKTVQYLENTKNGKTFLNRLIPEPENITAADIFSKIGELSLLGLIPVIGGITGGILGDKFTDKNWKQKVPDKIKEGTYQYLANIFLCNVGAGLALGIMEKFGVKSKTTRAVGMIAGITATGIIGGSAIANIIAQKIINPLIYKNNKSNNLYSERVPEAVDIGLHTDDIATVAVMSGFKWIEPALPLLYSVSGYRAGIGYRNQNIKKNSEDYFSIPKILNSDGISSSK